MCMYVYVCVCVCVSTPSILPQRMYIHLRQRQWRRSMYTQVRMYICTHTYIHIYILIRTCIHIHILIRTYMQIYTYKYLYVHIFMYVYSSWRWQIIHVYVLYIYTYTHVYVSVHMCVYTSASSIVFATSYSVTNWACHEYIFTYILVYTRIYTYIHTWRHEQRVSCIHTRWWSSQRHEQSISCVCIHVYARTNTLGVTNCACYVYIYTFLSPTASRIQHATFMYTRIYIHVASRTVFVVYIHTYWWIWQRHELGIEHTKYTRIYTLGNSVYIHVYTHVYIYVYIHLASSRTA